MLSITMHLSNIKNENYKLAYEYFLKAKLPQSLSNAKKILEQGLLKQNLYLVVGSDRGGTIKGCESHKNIAHIVHGLDVDVSPLRIFGKNGTTMDVRQSSVEGAKHIVGDASIFDFSKKYNVKHVLLERFPTAPQAAFEGRDSMLGNYAGACIKQISKAMKPGAILDYEWDPFFESLNASECQNAIQQNPFTGFMDLSLIFYGVAMLHCGESSVPSSMSEQVKAQVRSIAGKLNDQLQFFYEQGLGKSVPQLVEKMYWEAILLQKMHKVRPSNLHINCDLEVDSIEKFIEVAQMNTIVNSRNEVGKKIKAGSPPTLGMVYNTEFFVTRTLLNFIMVHMAAENNAPYVKTYLESIGFTDVSIERKTNAHNGRKNVWMIRAIKK